MLLERIDDRLRMINELIRAHQKQENVSEKKVKMMLQMSLGVSLLA